MNFLVLEILHQQLESFVRDNHVRDSFNKSRTGLSLVFYSTLIFYNGIKVACQLCLKQRESLTQMGGQMCQYSPGLGQRMESYFHHITSGINRSSFTSAQRRTAFSRGFTPLRLLQYCNANKAEESIFSTHMILLQLPHDGVAFAVSQ